jgi:uncharacterized protein YbjT (DUF2867 family)
MKIVVIGGSGLIGTKVVHKLRHLGHEVVAASPSSGVNTITGEGLAEALTGAQVVVDVANSPLWEERAVLEFFETSGRHLLAAEAAAGVGHHIALSVVGTERLLASGYFRAKMAQETLIKASPVPYTIVRATQFFEFVGSIAQSATDGQTVRLSPALMQPIVSDDVAAALVQVVVDAPVNGTIGIAGPEPRRLDALVRRFLSATQDPREVVTDIHALYFGIELNDQSLIPGNHARLGPTRFEDWLSRSIPRTYVSQAGSTPSSRHPPDRRCAARHPADAFPGCTPPEPRRGRSAWSPRRTSRPRTTREPSRAGHAARVAHRRDQRQRAARVREADCSTCGRTATHSLAEERNQLD